MVLDHLLTRRSVVANKLTEPGPDDGQLDSILKAACRAPDHKVLSPWRFILFRGDARSKFGEILADAARQEDENIEEKKLETEAQRLMRAPLVVCVITSFVDHPNVPEWEQILSTGAVCQNMLHAATSLGYASQWITEWYSYNNAVQDALGLNDNERIAGFIYIGTAVEAPLERKRPELDDIVTEWES